MSFTLPEQRKCRVCDGTGWAVDPATAYTLPCVCPARFTRTDESAARAREVAAVSMLLDSRRPRGAE